MSKIPKLRFKEFSAEWGNFSLGQFFTFKNGINANKEQYGRGYKFINVLDIINNNTIKHKDIIGSVDVSQEVFKKNIVEYGDILFQRSSEVREEAGQSNVYLDKEVPATFGGFVIRGKSKQKYHPEFMHYMLKTNLARKEISTKSNGSTRYNVGQETLSKVNIYVPLIPEQEKIASFLTLIDIKIEQLTKKEILLEQYKKSVMQKIFRQEFRFKDDDGNKFSKWKETPLKKIFKERKLLATKSEDYEHISLTTNGVVPKSKRYERDFLVGDDNSKKYKVTKLNDICYNPANLKFGVIARNKYADGIFSPIYVTFEVIDANIKFIEYFVTRWDFINKVRKYEEGTVYERQAVKPQDFLKFSIAIPTIEEQTKIANFLSSIDTKIEQAQKQLDSTKEFKKALLQQMFI